MTLVLSGTSTNPLLETVVIGCIGTKDGKAYDNITFEPLHLSYAVAMGASNRCPYECVAPISLLQFVQRQKKQGRSDTKSTCVQK